MRGIDDLDVSGRVVLLRADLNVPLDGATITDDGRIRASLPTISKLAGRGARVLVCAHLGRPKGASYAERAAGGPSLAPVAARLAELLGGEVPLAADVAGPSAAGVAAGLADGQVALLENVRFEPAETSKDDAERAGLAARLAALAAAVRGRRVRRAAPQARQRLRPARAAAARGRRPGAGRGRGAAQAAPRTRTGRTWSCSAARSRRTSSPSSRTCWTTRTGC